MIFCSNNDGVIWNTGQTVLAPAQAVFPIYDTLFYVTVYDTLGNFASDSVYVQVAQAPLVDIAGSDTTICGHPGNHAIFDAGAGHAHYLWNTGDTTQIINPDTPGTYIVDVWTATCHGYDTVVLSVVIPAIADAGSNESVCQNDPFYFSSSANVPNAVSYDSIKWIGGLGTFNYDTVLVPIYYHHPSELGPIQLLLPQLLGLKLKRP